MNDQKNGSTQAGDGGSAIRSLLSRLEAHTNELQRLLSAPKRSRRIARIPSVNTMEMLNGIRVCLADLAAMQVEVRGVSEIWAQSREKLWLEAESILKETCSRRQWQVHGSWPTYLVAYGVPVRFDEKTKSVSVGDNKLPHLDPEEIDGLLQQQIGALAPKEFAPSGFLEELFRAYEEVRGSRHQIPMLEVYRALVMLKQQSGFWRNAKRERFVELTMDQFRARITRMLEADAVRTKAGKDLRLFPPLDAKDGVFLYNPIDRRLGFVGRIEFTAGDERT